MRISTLRESFKAQVMNSKDGPKKVNVIMLNQLDYLYEVSIESDTQGIIVQSPQMSGIISEIRSLKEVVRGLLRSELHLERQLSPPKYSGSSSEGNYFYAGMTSSSVQDKV